MVDPNLSTIDVPSVPARVRYCSDCGDEPGRHDTNDGRRVCDDCVKGYCSACGAEDAIYTDEEMESGYPEALCKACIHERSARRTR